MAATTLKFVPIGDEYWQLTNAETGAAVRKRVSIEDGVAFIVDPPVDGASYGARVCGNLDKARSSIGSLENVIAAQLPKCRFVSPFSKNDCLLTKVRRKDFINKRKLRGDFLIHVDGVHVFNGMVYVDAELGDWTPALGIHDVAIPDVLSDDDE